MLCFFQIAVMTSRANGYFLTSFANRKKPTVDFFDSKNLAPRVVFQNEGRALALLELR